MQVLTPIAKTFDCGHGRQLRVSIPRGEGKSAYVTVADEGRNHPLLAHRDSPAITLQCLEQDLLDACLAVVAGTMTPKVFGEFLLARHPNLSHSEWRRSLVREWSENAVPVDVNRLMEEAVGGEP